MLTFKQHLTEAVSTEVSTALETVLGVAFSAYSNKNKKELTDAMTNDLQFAKANKFWSTSKQKDEKKKEKDLAKAVREERPNSH